MTLTRLRRAGVLTLEGQGRRRLYHRVAVTDIDKLGRRQRGTVLSVIRAFA